MSAHGVVGTVVIASCESVCRRVGGAEEGAAAELVVAAEVVVVAAVGFGVSSDIFCTPASSRSCATPDAFAAINPAVT